VRVNNIEEKSTETNEKNFKTFSALKEHIGRIIQTIEEDRQKYESSYENRTQYITMLEFKLMERFDAESQERKDMEKRMFGAVDERFSILKHELAKESKNRNESVENFTFYLETEIPKIIDQLKNEQLERDEKDNEISKLITEEFNRSEILFYFLLI
jgi:hypothetical protein